MGDSTKEISNILYKLPKDILIKLIIDRERISSYPKMNRSLFDKLIETSDKSTNMDAFLKIADKYDINYIICRRCYNDKLDYAILCDKCEKDYCEECYHDEYKSCLNCIN